MGSFEQGCDVSGCFGISVMSRMDEENHECVQTCYRMVSLVFAYYGKNVR